jgi:alkylation response protein AidB-like acyl-CoA dehydrogenase
MDVDTRLLRYFAAVAAEGNLTRAAERVFVSQPALTKQIRQLENLDELLGGNGLLLENHVARYLTGMEVVSTYEGTDAI